MRFDVLVRTDLQRDWLIPLAGSGDQLVADSGTNLLELALSGSSDSTNSSQTSNGDQCQHDGVLNSSRAIFFFDEVNDTFFDILHVISRE
jgi:hypothetical protein